MKQVTAPITIPGERVKTERANPNFSFSQWLVNSRNLRIYTARGSSSLDISLSKISKHNQVAEW
jgi:hypothetical protein